MIRLTIIRLRKNRSEISEEESILNHEPVGAFNKSDLYNAMIYPFTRMVITGVIWYQGNIAFDQ